jgi:hypothetical protein
MGLEASFRRKRCQHSGMGCRSVLELLWRFLLIKGKLL